MTNILESIPLSRNEDVERFLAFYDEQIEAGLLKSFAKYKKTKDLIVFVEEEEEAEEDLTELTAAIQKRRQQPDISFLSIFLKRKQIWRSS